MGKTDGWLEVSGESYGRSLEVSGEDGRMVGGEWGVVRTVLGGEWVAPLLSFNSSRPSHHLPLLCKRANAWTSHLFQLLSLPFFRLSSNMPITMLMSDDGRFGSLERCIVQ